MVVSGKLGRLSTFIFWVRSILGAPMLRPREYSDKNNSNRDSPSLHIHFIAVRSAHSYHETTIYATEKEQIFVLSK